MFQEAIAKVSLETATFPGHCIVFPLPRLSKLAEGICLLIIIVYLWGVNFLWFSILHKPTVHCDKEQTEVSP